jgi:hypothetical protein
MILSLIGFYVLLVIGFLLVLTGLLNLAGCGDRTGSEFKKSNIIQIIIGVFVFVGAFWL